MGLGVSLVAVSSHFSVLAVCPSDLPVLSIYTLGVVGSEPSSTQ